MTAGRTTVADGGAGARTPEAADASRPLGPDDLRAFIVEHGLGARLVVPGVPTPTVPAAAEALGVAPEAILKSLVFLVDDEPVLVVAAGTDRLKYPLLARAFDVSRRRVRLADAGEALAITGYAVGAMPPFGHRRPLPTVVDAARIAPGAVVYGGGGAQDALLELTTDELLQVTAARRVPLAAELDTGARGEAGEAATGDAATGDAAVGDQRRP